MSAPARRAALVMLLAVASPVALAHPGEHVGGFAHGFAHPMLGLDHLLAMVIVGVWAARLEGGSRWLLPAAFVTFMAVGAALGPLPLPFVEPMILASIAVFALGAIGAKRAPPWLGAAVVALFALFHGHAHFTEMPDTSVAGFLAGMLCATALLHALGVLVAVQVSRLRTRLA